jgi:hypothetical protein
MFVDQIFEECAEILGTTDEKRVYRKITQAVQTLMESGHWMQSTADVDVCTGWDGCTIALPRGIDVPLAVNVDGSPVYFRNRLFQYHVNKGGKFNSVEWAWDDRGYVATLMQIIQPSQLVAIAESENDVGKIIRLTGTDSNNRDLRSQLKDGTGVDGLLIPIHSQSDFAYGTIAPDDATIRTREVAVTPIGKFVSATPHTLDSGQGMAITAISGTIPVPLSNGQVYYIGVLDALTIQIYNDSLNAQAGNYPISLQSIVGAGPLKFLDSRTSFVVTALQFASAPTIEITTANPLTFPSSLIYSVTGTASNDTITAVDNILQNNQAIKFTALLGGSGLNTSTQYYVINRSGNTFQVSTSVGGSAVLFTTDLTGAISATHMLPIGLRSGVTYFGNLLDATHLQVFSSISDAQANINEIHTTGSTNPINVDIRKEIVPETKLDFNVPHLLVQGDQVQAFTSGGTLPTPLLANQNYFVNIIDSESVSIHTNQSDALGSSTTNFVNPIKLTSAGVGTISLVKLIPASAVAGEASQITAPGLSIPNPSGQDAEFTPVVVGGVRTVTVTNQGSGYTSSTIGIIFPDPPPKPIGSTITTKKATGYAIRNSISYQLIDIVLTDPGFGYTGTGPLSITIDPPPVATPRNVTNVFTDNLINVTVTTSGSHGFRTGDEVTITGADPAGYNGNFTVSVISSNKFTYQLINPIGNEVTITGLTCVGTLATAQTTINHGLSNGQTIYVSGAAVVGYNGNKVINYVNANTFTYAVPNGTTSPAGGTPILFTSPAIPDDPSVPIKVVLKAGTQAEASFTIETSVLAGFTKVDEGSGYLVEPQIEINGGGGSGATARGTVANGKVTSLTVVTSGTGYTSVPTALITPSTGVFLQFSSTGLMPTPLISGTSYRAEKPLNTLTGNFTVKNADFSKINVTSSPTGSFYVVLSRSFSVGFTNQWLGDFTNLSTYSEIYWGTDYLLPTTSPAIDVGTTPSYLEILSRTVARAYTSTISPAQLISVTAFGTGQSYFAKRFVVSPLPYNNLIQPSSVQFLQENETVKFATSGVMPLPLVAGTDYQVRVVGDSVNVYSVGALVPITTPGTGQLSLDIQRTFTASASTSIVADASLYTTGQSVTVRANSGDVLPNGLVAGTTYFIRRINNDEFELYATKAQSQNLSSIVGRKEFLTSGLSTDSRFFVDAIEDAILVKSVANIQKPLTDGFVSLYAMDYGRSNDLTLIGQYHPTEVNPQYRRIRIGKPCAWVRIAYRLKPPVITSKYDFIPIEHTRAIICGVHACDLEDKDFAEQSLRYWGFALAYLKNQQEHQDGHAFVPPQINDLTYGDGTDPVMF